jgi:hypothetical protein
MLTDLPEAINGESMFRLHQITKVLVASGLAINYGLVLAQDKTADVSPVPAEYVSDEAEQPKAQAHLAELAVEEAITKKPASGYYVERRSYGTGRETEPPRYVKQANKTWLKNYGLENADWLDIGLDYRLRYEYRDNDFRRSRETLDEPLLLRTRGFVAIREIFDPLRFTLEVEDARRNHSEFTREFDTRDINYAEPIQAYAELYFKEALGKDDLGNSRPLSIKAGRHAFEYLDRRLLARNEWRNTTNTFQGLRVQAGQQQNDWQLDLLALQPLQRFTDRLDQRDESQKLYGLIGDWRRWSQYATLQPYYLLLKQDGDKVEYDQNGRDALPNTRIDREIHTLGLRTYGAFKSGWDYDVNYAHQWGNQDRLSNNGTFISNLDHDAYAYNLEAGYSFKHHWKPRLSASFGFASGDKDPNDGENNRFERLYGFARPWSNNDYFQMENIVAPKVRLEFEPSWLKSLKIDTGHSWYRLDSATDRWNSANLRDNTGLSGRDVGEEFDVRARFPVGNYVAANIGYAHFWAGDFTTATSRRIDGDRRDESDFFYIEISVNTF